MNNIDEGKGERIFLLIPRRRLIYEIKSYVRETLAAKGEPNGVG